MYMLLIGCSTGMCEPLLFDDDAVIDMELAGPLSTLMSARQDREEYPFLLRVGDSDFSIKVRLRGKSRTRCLPGRTRSNWSCLAIARSVTKETFSRNM
jgi:hypothetical protein